MRLVLAAFLFSVVASLLVNAGSAQVRPGTRHFASSEECRFEFDYPSDGVIVPSVDAKPCRVRLRPADFAARMKELDMDVYTLDVGVGDGNFLEVAWGKDSTSSGDSGCSLEDTA